MANISHTTVNTKVIKDTIRKLVSFDTTSSGSNIELIEYAEEILAPISIECERIGGPEKHRTNLFATIGPNVPGGVVLSGHTDVVPVGGQNWHTDPFNMVEIDGRLYGRGTTDMKSFLGVALALAPEIAESNISRPIHFALSYDEEIGCLGLPHMLAVIAERKFQPSTVIVGEPTGMEVITAHKGLRAFKTTVSGLEAHSSNPQAGVNAIIVANKLLGFLRSLERDLKNSPDDNNFNPPYTTINVGMISGGTAINIVPNSCSFLWEYRSLPNEHPEKILKLFNAFVKEEYTKTLKAEGVDAEIITESIASIPPFQDLNNSPAVNLALKCAGKNRPEHASYASEAGLFSEAGFGTVLCGPGHISHAHKPNESVSIEQVESCAAFIRNLCTHLSVKDK